MKAKELQAEIEESLLRGATVLFESPAWRETMRLIMAGEWVDPRHLVRDFCRERANNIASGLASRVLTDEQLDSLAVLDCCSCVLCTEVKEGVS